MAGAQVKLSALTADATPTADVLIPYVNDPAGTPATRQTSYENFMKAYYSPDGTMVNGKLSVTVSANDLIVALKTLAGTDASATDPILIRINGTVRTCTAALSKTLADATNWFNAGAAETAAKEVDYFAYAIWNTTPATDIMDLGFARKPYFSVYSEASATTTSDNYLAYANGSAPAATDDMVNIGRFAATLSAGAGYTWTVPTFTLVNLKNRPTFESRWLTYAPTIAGYSSNPTTTVYIYQVDRNNCRIAMREGAAGTSNNTAHTYTAPFTAATRTSMVWWGTSHSPMDNSVAIATGNGSIASASASIAMIYGAAAWTASGSSRVQAFNIVYEI